MWGFSKSKISKLVFNYFSLLEELSNQFNKEKKNLKIDFDDILNDAFACYKDPGFDPKKPLKIQISVQLQ